MKYKPSKDKLAELRSQYQQVKASYDASISAMRNGDLKNSVSFQLAAIEALNVFNDTLLKEQARMRTGIKQDRIP